MLDLWLRLYTHALLRESRIFPHVELSDEPPDCLCSGFADIWNGQYHGELVCIKTIRTMRCASLTKIEKVCDNLILSETYSVCIIPDIPSCKQRRGTLSSSERASCHQSFGGAVSTFHHESIYAKRKHRTIHPEKPKCQSADVCMCPPT